MFEVMLLLEIVSFFCREGMLWGGGGDLWVIYFSYVWYMKEGVKGIVDWVIFLMLIYVFFKYLWFLRFLVIRYVVLLIYKIRIYGKIIFI